MSFDPPVIIPCFNNPTYVAGMLRQLQERKLGNIILVDNNSSYPEMLELLDKLRNDVRVIRLRRNHGPEYFFRNWFFYLRLPDFFCVTDPDLRFNPAMPLNFIDVLKEATMKFNVGKAGLALDISDTSRLRSVRISHGGKNYSILEWEAQFWKHQISTTGDGDPIYSAPIDTTFAVYNKAIFKKKDPFRAVRFGGRFVAQHLPWYVDVGLPKKEEEFYRATGRSYSWYFGEKTTG